VRGFDLDRVFAYGGYVHLRRMRAALRLSRSLIEFEYSTTGGMYLPTTAGKESRLRYGVRDLVCGGTDGKNAGRTNRCRVF
jgi:hypothetical protein